MGKECLNCLQSSSGYCGLHAPVLDYVSSTSTSNNRRYTKREVEEEVIYFAKMLCGMKWYQNKRHILKSIVRWANFLKKWDKK
jgi:hypothetical protein